VENKAKNKKINIVEKINHKDYLGYFAYFAIYNVGIQCTKHLLYLVYVC